MCAPCVPYPPAVSWSDSSAERSPLGVGSSRCPSLPGFGGSTRTGRPRPQQPRPCSVRWRHLLVMPSLETCGGRMRPCSSSVRRSVRRLAPVARAVFGRGPCSFSSPADLSRPECRSSCADRLTVARSSVVVDPPRKAAVLDRDEEGVPEWLDAIERGVDLDPPSTFS